MLKKAKFILMATHTDYQDVQLPITNPTKKQNLYQKKWMLQNM
ncbi:hypothetical protein T9H88_12140 [Staphylococcus aureus]|nr:hypothetical protein T9H88_12140 [Staphylococcus aureus]